MMCSFRVIFFLLVVSLSVKFLSADIRFGSSSSKLSFLNANSYFVVDDPISGYSGTLEFLDNSPGRVSGFNILFDSGTVKVGKTSVTLTGTYDPSQQNRVALSNEGTVELPSGTVTQEVRVASGSSASIVGAPNFTKPIVLEDSGTELKLGIQSQVSQNIELNGGKIVLEDNLSLQAGRQFVGGGIIDVNGRTLKLPKGNASTGRLTFISANDVALSGNLIDSSEYFFTGDGGTSELNGNRYTWEFVNGGFITVDANHTLYCVNVDFKGMGNYPTHGFFNLDPTATVVFQGCNFSFDNHYTHSSGTLEFSSGCVLYPNGNKFNVSDQGVIRVNGSSLVYDYLMGPDVNPFTFTNEVQQKQLVNGGNIRSTFVAPRLIVSENVKFLHKDYDLTGDTILQVPNENPGSPKSVTIDGSGYRLTFPRQNNLIFQLDPNVNLTLKNVTLFDYNKDAVFYGDANSSMIFGSGVRIRLFENETISDSDKPWTFSGDCQIRGVATKLVLDGTSRITVGPLSTLTLKDLKVAFKNADSISILDSASKIILENCDLILGSSGWNIPTGNIEIKGKVRFFGGSPTDPNLYSVVTFSSSGTFKVMSESIMKLGKSVEFKYQPDPSLDGGLTYNTKRHFILTDATSILELDGCTLHSTMTGMALDYGRLIVSDRSIFKIDGFNGNEAEIGSALEVYIKPSTTLVVTGTLVYNQTTLP